MADSILDSIKRKLGLASEYDVFDLDIITHINSALFNLTQIGVGPQAGFMIEDDKPTWDAFLGEGPKLIAAKTFVFIKVKLAFDPPATSFHLASLENQAKEIEWRLMIAAETDEPTVEIVPPLSPPVFEPPVTVPVPVDTSTIDGGGADDL